MILIIYWITSILIIIIDKIDTLIKLQIKLQSSINTLTNIKQYQQQILFWTFLQLNK